MLPYFADNNKLYFTKISGEFIDICLPEDYNKFKLFIKQNMNIDNFKINEDASLTEALEKIEKNKKGVILTIDKNNKVTGLATDGDIRRFLLKKKSLNWKIKNCHNKNFSWVDNQASREIILKKFDNRIKILPILNEYKELSKIYTRDYLPPLDEKFFFARSRSPVRISFGGGGSDLTYFFSKHKGAVINATISLYSHASLKKRSDKKIIIESLDLQTKLIFKNYNELMNYNGKFNLIKCIIKTVHPNYGFELFLNSDYPINSGLGGSAVVSSTVLGCFNEFRHDKWDDYQLAELAYQAERLFLGVSGGWQDQYSTIFGGLNFIEFNSEENLVHTLRLNKNVKKELEECLVLCDTKTIHNSGNIHDDLANKIVDKNLKKLIEENVKLCVEIKNSLTRGKLSNFAELLDKSWQIKKSLSNKISNNHLDEIYQNALRNGAIGGKLLGAGGGGFFLFFVSPFRKFELINYLNSIGLNIMPFVFEEKGLESWVSRLEDFNL